MEINSANLDSLRAGFSTHFQAGVGTAPSQYRRIATYVKATQMEQKYGWLGKLPRVREWIGPRLVHSLAEHDYAIKEKPWELTIGVNRDHIETDNLGIYPPLFQSMGAETQTLPDELVFGTLKAGWATKCFDGQYFFDTDHPVLDENGVETSVANTDGGAGAPWFLLCTTKPILPMIYQERKTFQFVAKDDPTDERVFNNNEFVYGADARSNVGFGFWQLAWGSKQTLNAANYAAARAALTTMKGDYGKPLGLMPNLLVVAGTLESAARKILNNENAAGGETNEWKGTAELMVCPWL